MRVNKSPSQSGKPTLLNAPKLNGEDLASKSHLLVTEDEDYQTKLACYLQEKKIVSRLQQQSKLAQERYI